MRTIKKLSLFATASIAALLAVPAQASTEPQPDHDITTTGQHVVINLPQTRLFYYENGKLVKTYPVAVGKSWTRTPAGEYDVRGVFNNSTWNVPVSIQDEMRRGGKTVTKASRPAQAIHSARSSSAWATRNSAWASTAPMRRRACRTYAATVACA